MFRQTRCYIDLARLRHNVAQVRMIIGNIPQMVMVKADAYGHGMLQVARAATVAGAQWLGVALAEEGAMLRENGIVAPILIVGPLCSPEEVVRFDLRQSVCTPDDIYALQSEAERQQKFVAVHIKVDTGMNRIGLKGDEALKEVLDAVSKCPCVIAEGIFTHFSSADSSAEFTRKQAEQFEHACELAESMGYKLLKHAANSAATILYPEFRYDLVRLGIIAYGYPPADEIIGDYLPVLSFKAGITYVKDVEAGEAISYERTFIADRPMRVATIAVGYGDGYRRTLSNRADVIINGKRAKILGNICMDQMMVDVTDIPDVAVGDEAVLIGEEGNEKITAQELADLLGTISYEIMLSITERVPKVYINE